MKIARGGERDIRALWFNTGEKEGYTISEGSTILRGLAELCLIDQRHQTGLKLTLCGKASATPFCQHLSCDFRSQALSRFFLQVKKLRGAWGRGYMAASSPGLDGCIRCLPSQQMSYSGQEIPSQVCLGE